MVLLRRSELWEGGKGDRHSKKSNEKTPRSQRGQTTVNWRDGDLRLGREWKSAGTAALCISSAEIKAGRSRDVMLTTSGLYLQQAAAIVILLLNSIVYAELCFLERP